MFYAKSSRYCLKLGQHVDDPGNPPCLKARNQTGYARPAEAYAHRRSGQTSYTQPSTVRVPEAVPVTTGMGTQQLLAPTAQTVQAYVDYYEGTQVAYPVPPQPVIPQYQPPVQYQVPSDRVSTGNLYLDRLLGGGFLRGKTYLVAGETGCGKTIFSIQFLRAGAQLGEPGIYVAIDEPTDQLLRGLERFGWGDIRAYTSGGLLRFLDMRTHFSKIYMRDLRKHIEPRYVIESILKEIKRTNAKRLVIDPIAPLIYGGSKDDVLYAREFLREMVFALEKLGTVTTVMTSEIPTGSKQLSRFGVEEFLASGIIVLSIEEIRGQIYRVMFIRKARWSPVKPSKYVFEIVEGQGVVIRGPLVDFM